MLCSLGVEENGKGEQQIIKAMDSQSSGTGQGKGDDNIAAAIADMTHRIR